MSADRYDKGVLHDAKEMLATHAAAKREGDWKRTDGLARSFIVTDGPNLVRELERLAEENAERGRTINSLRAQLAECRDRPWHADREGS